MELALAIVSIRHYVRESLEPQEWHLLYVIYYHVHLNIAIIQGSICIINKPPIVYMGNMDFDTNCFHNGYCKVWHKSLVHLIWQCLWLLYECTHTYTCMWIILGMALISIDTHMTKLYGYDTQIVIYMIFIYTSRYWHVHIKWQWSLFPFVMYGSPPDFILKYTQRRNSIITVILVVI